MRRTLPTDLQALGCTPLFEGCSRRQLCRAWRFCTFVDVRPGRVLCRRGQRPLQLVILISGRALAVDACGTRYLLGPGDHFGAVAGHDGAADEPLTVTAHSSGTLMVVGRRELAGLLDVCPTVAARLTDHAPAFRTDQRLERIAAGSTATSALQRVS